MNGLGPDRYRHLEKRASKFRTDLMLFSRDADQAGAPDEALRLRDQSNQLLRVQDELNQLKLQARKTARKEAQP